MNLMNLGGRRQTKRNGYFPLISMTLGVGLLTIATVFVEQYIIPYAIVAWDEAAYLLSGYTIYTSLRSLDGPALVSKTLSQYIYPPFESWFWAISLVPFGFSIFNARVISLILFVLSGIFLYAIGVMLPRRTVSSAHTTALLGLMLFTQSPMMLVHAGLGLKEMMGTVLTLVILFTYFRTRDTDSQVLAVVTGLCIFLLGMTKYNYAAIFIIALGIELVLGRKTPSWTRLTTKIHTIILATLGIGIVTWMATEGSKLTQYFYSQNEMTIGIGSVADKILFYPRSILYLYSLHPLIGLVLLVCLAHSFFFLRNYYQLRFMTILILVNTVMVGIWTNNLHDRYIITIVPCIFLLSAWSINRWIFYVQNRWRLVPNVLLCFFLIGISVMYASPSFIKMVYATGSYSLRIPLFNQPDYRDRWFVYNKSLWSHMYPWQSKEKPADVFDYVLQTIDTEKPYLIIGYTDAFSPKLFDLLMSLDSGHSRVNSLYPSYIVTIEVLPKSRYFTREYQMYIACDLSEIRSVSVDQHYRKIASRTFEDLGVLTTIYVPL